MSSALLYVQQLLLLKDKLVNKNCQLILKFCHQLLYDNVDFNFTMSQALF